MNEPTNTLPPLVCRGIRGATTVTENTRDAILAATRELLKQIIAANQLVPEDIASAFFTLTYDLNAEYPAVAARQLGWHDVPLLCTQEIEHPKSLPRVIRVLIHWNTSLPQHEIKHIYTNGAEALRPDRYADSK